MYIYIRNCHVFKVSVNGKKSGQRGMESGNEVKCEWVIGWVKGQEGNGKMGCSWFQRLLEDGALGFLNSPDFSDHFDISHDLVSQFRVLEHFWSSRSPSRALKLKILNIGVMYIKSHQILRRIR